jgi:hypothetical protein
VSSDDGMGRVAYRIHSKRLLCKRWENSILSKLGKEGVFEILGKLVKRKME